MHRVGKSLVRPKKRIESVEIWSVVRALCTGAASVVGESQFALVFHMLAERETFRRSLNLKIRRSSVGAFFGPYIV